MPGSPEARLIIGAFSWTNWVRYELEADYESPADAWTVEVAAPSAAHMAVLSTGLPVVVLVDNAPALRGWLERIELRRGRQSGLTLVLSGRDLAAPLVDCCPGASWSLLNTNLQVAATKALAELGIPAVVEPAPEALVPVPLIKAEPGESYWQMLTRYCRRQRLMMSMSPAGVLSLGRPDYITPPVCALVHGGTPATAPSTNVLEVEYVDDISSRYSQVTVLGQGAGGGTLFGQVALSQVLGVATDAALLARGLHRPLVLDDGHVSSPVEATDRARYEVSMRAYRGQVWSCVVAGHGPVRGVLWAPDQTVTVLDEVSGVTGLWWVSGRRMIHDRQQGTRTALTCHPAGTLLPPV